MWFKKDARPPKGSWAPGGYACVCLTCGSTFDGDKRAVSCADCAYAEPDALTETDARNIVSTVFRHALSRRRLSRCDESEMRAAASAIVGMRAATVRDCEKIGEIVDAHIEKSRHKLMPGTRIERRLFPWIRP